MAPGEGRKAFPGWPGPSSGRTRGRRSSGRGLCWGPPCPTGQSLGGWWSPLLRAESLAPPPCPPRAQGRAEHPLCCWEVLWVSVRGSPETGPAFPDTPRTCPARCTSGLGFEVALVPALHFGGSALPPALPSWHLPPNSPPGRGQPCRRGRLLLHSRKPPYLKVNTKDGDPPRAPAPERCRCPGRFVLFPQLCSWQPHSPLAAGPAGDPRFLGVPQQPFPSPVERARLSPAPDPPLFKACPSPHHSWRGRGFARVLVRSLGAC